MFELIPNGTIEAFGLFLVRTSALILAAPLLGVGAGFSGYKVALVVALSFLFYLVAGSPLEEQVGGGTYAIMALREILIGAFLAFALHAALLSMSVAGQVIGHEMGFNMSNQVDPISGVNTPMISQLYETLFFIGLLSVNGHHWIVKSLGNSFDRAPIGVVDFNSGAGVFVLDLFSEMFTAGLTFAAPVMILLSLVSVLIGLLARVVPQLNMLEIGFTLRIGVGLFAMLLFSPLLVPALDQVYEFLDASLQASLDTISR